MDPAHLQSVQLGASVCCCQMPTALHRYQQLRQLHFVTFSCYGRQSYLGDAASRDMFESSLERVRKRYAWAVIGYVVMPEHLHLLVNEPRLGNLARAIQALKISVARRRPQWPFWLARYYDFNVWSAEKEIEKLKYLHRNPVVRGLVTRPDDWPWSSYRHYATGSRGAVEIESQWTAFQRGNQLPEALRYAKKAD
jgi:putative transposase